MNDIEEKMEYFYRNLPGGLNRNIFFNGDKIKLFKAIDNIISVDGFYERRIRELNSIIRNSNLQIEREYAEQRISEIAMPIYEELRKRGFDEYDLN